MKGQVRPGVHLGHRLVLFGLHQSSWWVPLLVNTLLPCTCKIPTQEAKVSATKKMLDFKVRVEGIQVCSYSVSRGVKKAATNYLAGKSLFVHQKFEFCSDFDCKALSMVILPLCIGFILKFLREEFLSQFKWWQGNPWHEQKNLSVLPSMLLCSQGAGWFSGVWFLSWHPHIPVSDSCDIINMSPPSCSPARMNVCKLAFDFSLLATDLERYEHSHGPQATKTCYRVIS